ncbi:MAG: sigma-70 family RNA polymerase sigma factor [Nannocystaceae bacterium]|nr:sigma-70 family RNA polymerase sigma factor [Nannocystaceae bacterium]
MDDDVRERLEADIRGHCDAASFAEAVTAAVKGYGPEVLGYLLAMTKSEVDATDAFSLWCEDVWRGLPRFRWASSFRTWSYTLARHALSRLSRDPERRRIKVAITGSHELQELAVQVRTTAMLARTDEGSRADRLREQLEPDDRTLLILRVDRRLSWQDIARVFLADNPDAGDDDVAKTSAMLRKRFERVKERLRKLAAEG